MVRFLCSICGTCFVVAILFAASGTMSPTIAEEIVSERAITTHFYFSKTEHQHAAAWGYEGRIAPQFWGSLDPAYRLASQGKQQSPIDIESNSAAWRGLATLTFDYQVEKIVSINNGHTIQHDDRPGSFLSVGGDRYALEQFHVHTPSEHTVDGRHFPMEIHFVHKSDAGQVAVVAALVEANPAGTIDLPLHYRLPAQAGEETRYTGQCNPTDLLPQDRDYFEYHGSFTTPPCTEGIRWIVLKQPVQAHPHLIERFAAILQGNSRPVQPLNGREVEVSAVRP